MLKSLRRLFDTRSSMERAIDAAVTADDVTASTDTHLNRRAIPALIVSNYHDRNALLHNIRYATVCIENRLQSNASEIASGIETYDWTSDYDGPSSPVFVSDMCRMASTNWSDLAVLGVRKTWTFGGDLRPRFYSIETTDECINAMFNDSPLSRKDVEPVVVDFLDEHDCTVLNFATQLARDEANSL